MIYVGYFGLMHIFNPQAFAPGRTMAYWNKTPFEDNSLDDLFVFVGKLEGAILLTFAFAMLEILIVDRSVERIRWNNIFATVAGTFYVLVWLRALFDTSGYVKKSQWIRTIIFEIISLGVCKRLLSRLVSRNLRFQCRNSRRKNSRRRNSSKRATSHRLYVLYISFVGIRLHARLISK